jgi:CBS domain-containing protein
MESSICDHMTATPYTVTQDLPLSEALELMETNSIRHLPVEYSGNLVGILLYSDVRHALELRPTRLMKVESVMLRHPYAVPPDVDLAEVVLEMSKTKQDYAVVQEGSKIIGIFTATDALLVLSKMLRFQSQKAA